MASYRFSSDTVSRGKGQSAIAKAAYDTRSALRDDRTGEMKDYSRGKGLLFEGIFAPKDAPEWMHDRAELWNAVERQEDQSTRPDQAQLARYIELNIPHELMDPEKGYQDGIRLVRDFVREQFVRRGMVADVAIHAPHAHGDERNFHAHVRLTMREIDGDQFAAKKNRDWNNKALHLDWKEKWAAVGARYLANLAKEHEKAGRIEDAQRLKMEAERYSYGHLSLKEQAREAARRGDEEHAKNCDREPTQHLGPNAAAQERRGIETERGASYSQSIEEQKLREDLRDVEKQIAAEVERQERDDKDKGNAAPPPLSKTAGEIRMAYSLTATGQEFVSALEDRGLIVATATGVDIEIEKARTGATEKWQLLREDEIVVINQYGDLYRLTERNTGDNWKARQEHLKDVDRAALLTVTQARTVADDLRQHRQDEWKIRAAQSEIRVSGNWGNRGPQNDDRQKEIRDRAERMSTANELASVADESKNVVLDWVERRTMANEKAAERTRTRDS